VIAGVAGAESANNAASSGAFIAALHAWGFIQCDYSSASRRIDHSWGAAGPSLIEKHPDIFLGHYRGMYNRERDAVVLRPSAYRSLGKNTEGPYKILFPLLLLLCIIGSYSTNNSKFDVLVMLIFGVIRLRVQKVWVRACALIIAFVLGPILETSLRQSLLISKGDISIFFARPISVACLLIALVVLLLPVVLQQSRV